MFKKKMRKLFRNPQAFWRDSKLNYKNKSLKIEKIGKDKDEIKKNKVDKINIYNAENKEIYLKPIENFNVNYLIDNLKVPGIYIKPLDQNAKWAICVRNSDKERIIKEFLKFIYDEGFTLKYKYNSSVKTPKTINEFWTDISTLKKVDIRLSTNRTLNLSLFWFRFEFWDEFDDYYMAPVANYISRKLFKRVAEEHEIFKVNQIIDYRKILAYPHEKENTLEIDLVFTWVNSDDEDWKKIYHQYKPEEAKTDATSTSRFLSRDELKYALRSWDLYGKFIRNIYIISNCKPPKWLNLEEKNIFWVYHEEIMPKGALPTFNSHAIETSLHKIKGLSNYFIYSNDDLFLTRPSSPNDFYYSNGIVKLKLENYGMINDSVCREDPDYLNAARNGVKLLEATFGKTATQLHTHSMQSMRIDILNEIEKKYSKNINETLHNKFRTINDISIASFLYPHYSYMSGNAIQSDIEVMFIQQNHPFKKRLNNLIKLKDKYAELPLSVCINDGADSHLNESWNTEVVRFLEAFFPKPSKYEK